VTPPLSDDLLRGVLEPVPGTFDEREGVRLAAVLAPWFTRDQRDWLLMTRRRDDLPHHPGQVS